MKLKSVATFMRELNRSSLVQMMDWCLFGAKTLPEPMLIYYCLGIQEQSLVISEKYTIFFPERAFENVI